MTRLSPTEIFNVDKLREKKQRVLKLSLTKNRMRIDKKKRYLK